MDTLNEKLAPCPFCGSDAEIKDYPECIPKSARCIYYAEVHCSHPQCQAGLWEYTKEEAIKAWNTRIGKDNEDK